MHLDVPKGFAGKARVFQVYVMLALVISLWVRYLFIPRNPGIVGTQENVTSETRNHPLQIVSTIDPLRPRYNYLDDKLKQDTHYRMQHTRKVQSLEPPNCTKTKFNVSFLNVHNAGSTTMVNIFLRFAKHHKLNIVLPRNSSGWGFNYLGFDETLSQSNIIPLPGNQVYNILCNHVVYNKAAFRSILPNDTVYVGIIREPVSHFTSSATSYRFFRRLRYSTMRTTPKAKVIGLFLKHPSQFKIKKRLMHNRMSFDFGVPKDRFDDAKFVGEYIADLERDFSLVLILERFLESLVLLKRILCWNTKDILYYPLSNTYKPEFKLDDTDIKNLRKWNSADFKLYRHFYDVFNAKVEALGQDFQEEVESFTATQKGVDVFCKKEFKRRRSGPSVFKVARTKWNNGFTVSVQDCKLMMKKGIPMMSRLVKSGWSRYHEYLKSKERFS